MDKRIVNVDTDESQTSEVARALGHSGEMSEYVIKDNIPGAFIIRPPSVTLFTVEPDGEVTFPSTSRRGRFVGEAPPLVPTPEAVETWGHLWWRQMGGTGEVVLVMNFPADDPVTPLGFYEPMSRTPRRVEGDCFWSGPVLERPVKKEG